MVNDVMLDLETFGNSKQAAICQIGACYFDRETGAIGNQFKVNVDASTSGELDASNVYWWLSQSKEAQASICAPPLVNIGHALIALNEFLVDAKQIWSHATYDFVILTETYRRLGIKPSFKYRAARDIRTLVDLAKITIDKTPRTGLHHDGLQDALHQVKYCVLAMNKLKGKHI